MDDTRRMGRSQCVADLDRIKKVIPDLCFLAHQVAERLTLDKLGSDIVDALVVADVIDRDDSGVVQLCHRSGLKLETLYSLVICDVPRRQDLQRDLSAEFLVKGEINLTHSARAEEPFDLEVRYPFIDEGERRNFSLVFGHGLCGDVHRRIVQEIVGLALSLEEFEDLYAEIRVGASL